jgi:hypothetical protein
MPQPEDNAMNPTFVIVTIGCFVGALGAAAYQNAEQSPASTIEIAGAPTAVQAGAGPRVVLPSPFRSASAETSDAAPGGGAVAADNAAVPVRTEPVPYNREMIALLTLGAASEREPPQAEAVPASAAAIAVPAGRPATAADQAAQEAASQQTNRVVAAPRIGNPANARSLPRGRTAQRIQYRQNFRATFRGYPVNDSLPSGPRRQR